MAPLLLLLLLLLLFPHSEAFGRAERTHLFHRPGDEAVLPCDLSPSPPGCSGVTWLFSYSQDSGGTAVAVGVGPLSLDSDCSLLIGGVREEHAGRYVCGLKDSHQRPTPVILSVFTFSWSPVDSSGSLEVQCGLKRPFLSASCVDRRFRWLDRGTGTVLSGKDGFRLTGDGCVSTLVVEARLSRNYTCQYIDGDKQVHIQADYTSPPEGETGKPSVSGWSPLSYFLLTARVAGLIVMIRISAVLVRDGANQKPPDCESE